MSGAIFNKREKLSAPPFITLSVQDEERKKNIFRTWSKLRSCGLDEKSVTFTSEGELLKAFVIRKGTQLRLEKALMLTRRILTIVLRWKSNGCLVDFSKFRDAFDPDQAKKLPKKRVGKGKMMEHVKGNMKQVHLPSRQWSNWVIYLTLRDLLLLSKIKYKCERTVGYWLGLISCSHHPADSLIIVGILSRIWAVSSGMVEDYANQVYPSLCFISTLLSPTKADNWLQDIDFPNELFPWLENILGFPFHPARLWDGKASGGTSQMDKIRGVFGGSQGDKKSFHEDAPSTSSNIRDRSANYNEEEEDLGVPVNVEKEYPKPRKAGPSIKKGKKGKGRLPAEVGESKKIVLNERWTKFFKNFKAKLETDGGRRQLLTRIKKYKKTESSPEIIARLQKVLKFVKLDKRDKLLLYISKFKKFLTRKANKNGTVCTVFLIFSL